MNFISQPVEIDRDKIDSRYRFAIAVAKRAKQLNEGAMPAVKSRAKKITTLALEEVATGAVPVLSGDEAIQARQEAERSAFDNIMDEAGQKKTVVEDMTELEEDLRKYLKGKRKEGKEYFPWEDVS